MNYPQHASDVLEPRVRFKPGAIQAIRAFQVSHPWRGSLEERMQKMRSLLENLNRVYNRSTKLEFADVDDNVFSGSSAYSGFSDTIILSGRLSAITFLHEYAHALGKREKGAVRWSLNLFREVFPKSFSKLHEVGHVMVRRADEALLSSQDSSAINFLERLLRRDIRVEQHERGVK